MVAPTDRWLYAVSLLMAYITAHIFEETDLTNKTLIIGTAISAVYFRYCFYMDSFHWQIYAIFSILAAMAIINGRFVKNRSFSGILYLLLILVSISFNILYSFSPNYWGLARNGTDLEIVKNVEDGQNKVLDQLNDDSFFRYAGDSLPTNESIHGKYSTPQYYWSVVDDNIVAFRKAVGLADRSNHHFKNYDDRFLLDALSGIKYYLSGSEESVPYGFSFMRKLEQKDVYINDHWMPIIYGYDASINEEEWLSYDALKRNEILGKAAVLSDIDHETDTDALSFDSIELLYKIAEQENVSLENNAITVSSSGGFVKLLCEHAGEGEYYIAIEGLESDESTNLDVQYKGQFKTLYFKGKDNTHYADRHDYLINLGCLKSLDETILISFSDPGEFKYSSIRICYLPLEGQIKEIEKMNNVRIDSLTVNDDQIDAQIETKMDEIVCFAIPYSKGWKAYVDGEKAEVLQCNIQYMALKLDAGKHVIEFRYETPMFKAGSLISFAGILGFAAIYLRKNKSKAAN